MFDSFQSRIGPGMFFSHSVDSSAKHLQETPELQGVASSRISSNTGCSVCSTLSSDTDSAQWEPVQGPEHGLKLSPKSILAWGWGGPGWLTAQVCLNPQAGDQHGTRRC